MSVLYLFFVLVVLHTGEAQNGTKPLMPPDFAFVQQSSSGGVPPEPRQSPALGFSPDGQLAYVMGGKNGVGVTLTTFFTYDFNSTTWGNISITRPFHGSCYGQYTGPDTGKNKDIWMYGRVDQGKNQLARFNFTFIDTVSWDSPQVALNGGCTVTSDAHFFVFGGTYELNANCTNELYMFNGTWHLIDAKGQVPSKRYGAGLVSFNRTHLYTFGGACNDGDVDNELYFIDITTGVWSKVEVTGPKPPNRHSHSLSFDFSAGTPRLLIFGGESFPAGNNTLNDAWRFDIHTSTWSVLGFNQTQSWPEPRSHFGHAFFGGRLALFGGIDSQGNLNSDLWQLVLNDDCFSRLTCEDCVTGVAGCGWCHNNDKGFKCIAGASYGPFLPGSCLNASATTWTVEFLTCPLDEFPGWIIALVIIGCIVLVGVVIYFVMKMKQKGANYEVID